MKAKLIHGDCRSELAKLKAESVDLIFTSPPYAEQRKSQYGGIPPAEYVDWFHRASRGPLIGSVRCGNPFPAETP